MCLAHGLRCPALPFYIDLMFVHFGGLVVGCRPSCNEIFVAVATRLRLTNEPLPEISVIVLLLNCMFVITVGLFLAGPCSELRCQNVEGGWVKEIAHQCPVRSFDLVSRPWVEQK